MASEKILNKKKELVAEVSENFKSSVAMVLADYRGLTVEEDTKMRKELREAGVTYKVIKNRIAKFAATEAGLDDLAEHLTGPTAIAMSNDDVVTPAKILAKFAKDFEALEIKAGVLEGKVIDIATVEQLAKTPSKEELYAGLANVLIANIRGFAVALNEVAAKMGEAKVEEPAVAAEEVKAEEPKVEEPAVEEVKAEESVAEEPAVEEAEAVVEEPATEE